jgi:HSP20 family protein
MNHETQVQRQESAPANGTERTKTRPVYVPLVDIFEAEDALILVADMPGVDEQGLDLTLEKNVLTIKGTISEGPPAGIAQVYTEYGVGDYERTFTIPNEVDREAIQATVRQGVLRLTMPKSKQAQTRKISVTAG